MSLKNGKLTCLICLEYPCQVVGGGRLAFLTLYAILASLLTEKRGRASFILVASDAVVFKVLFQMEIWSLRLAFSKKFIKKF